MEKALPLLSVVSPAYQEEEVLPAFHASLSRALAPLAAGFEIEILYVDDGSTDGTLAVLRRLAADDPRVRFLSLSRNFGHQAALTAGLEHARGDAVVSLDSDLQHPPALIPGLVERWRQGYDAVLTERQDAAESGWFKRRSSAGFYWLLARLSDTPVSPAASDFRLLSRRALDALLQMRECHRFLRTMVNWLGFPVTTIPYQAAPRAAGRPRYTLRRMLRLAGDGLVSFSRLPLRLPLLVGPGLLLLGLIGLVGLAVAGLAGRGAGAWPVYSVALLTLALNGLVLTSLGVMGEYVGRVYEQVKQRPIYLLKETSPGRGDGEGAVPPWRRPGNSAA